MDEEKCQQCGTPASPGAKYCESCGALLPGAPPESPFTGQHELQPETQRQGAPTNVHPAEYQASVPTEPSTTEYQGVGIRFIAVLVDSIIIAVISSIISAPFSPNVNITFAPNVLTSVGALISALITFIYFVLLEGTYGQTFGKMIFKIKVVQVTGTKITYTDAVVRTILRIIDAIPYVIPYLLGALLIGASDTKQRFGDRVAHTVVVKA